MKVILRRNLGHYVQAAANASGVSAHKFVNDLIAEARTAGRGLSLQADGRMLSEQIALFVLENGRTEFPTSAEEAARGLGWSEKTYNEYSPLRHEISVEISRLLSREGNGP